MSKTIGILGGMGPMATVDLFKKIVTYTPATIDNDHIPIIIYNNPQIPSRVDAILVGKENPLTELMRTARRLENAGADFIIIPCHTAHVWLNEIQTAIRIPIYSMIENTVSCIEVHYRHLRDRILLLGTKAILQKRLYQNAFEQRGLKLQVPESSEQDIVTSAILEVKGSRIENNSYIEPLNRMLNRYYSSGVTAVLGACTEIPLLFPYLDPKIEKLDPTLMLANMAIDLALKDNFKAGDDNDRIGINNDPCADGGEIRTSCLKLLSNRESPTYTSGSGTHTLLRWG
ncbi:MAG: cysteate racemase [Desulfitobacteriaceae bacterium]